MHTSKTLGQSVNNAIAPHEDEFMRLQDILLGFKPIKLAILAVVVNSVFLLIYLLSLPCYSVILLAAGLFLLSDHYAGLVLSLAKGIILEQELYVIPEDSAIQRFTVPQVSAFIGTVFYVVEGCVQTVIKGVNEKHVMTICITMFGFLFMFFLFLSLSDMAVVWLTVHGIMALPYLWQLPIGAWYGRATASVTAAAEKAGSSLSHTEVSGCVGVHEETSSVSTDGGCLTTSRAAVEVDEQVRMAAVEVATGNVDGVNVTSMSRIDVEASLRMVGEVVHARTEPLPREGDE